jgi:hypothetical protein
MAPTISGLDFPGFLFLEICETSHLYSARIHNIQRLKLRTIPDFLGRVWQEMEYHFDVCRATNGARMELR